MYSLLVQPILTGISTGVFCMTYCVPFVAPMLVMEKRDWKQTAKVLALFMLGRLIGYIAFGALFGCLGEALNDRLFNTLSMISLIILSALLILHALGLIRTGSWLCGIRSSKTKLPFWIGFLTGINMCPPFLLSLNYVFTLHYAWRGILFFALFFLGTNIYFVPLVFLSHLSQIQVFQRYARYAALVVGSSFILYAVYFLWRGIYIWH